MKKITASQFRSARCLLSWSLHDAVAATSLSSATLNRAENKNTRAPSEKALRLLALTYEKHGVEFIIESDAIGVKLRKSYYDSDTETDAD